MTGRQAKDLRLACKPRKFEQVSLCVWQVPRNLYTFHLQHSASLRNAVNTVLPSAQQIIRHTMQPGALPEPAVEQPVEQAVEHVVREYKNQGSDDYNDADM